MIGSDYAVPGGGERAAHDRWLLSALGELLVAVIAVILLVRLTFSATHWEAVRVTDLTIVLSLSAVAAGATSAILSRMSAHLRREPRSLWLCLALLVYTVVASPAVTVGASSRWDEAAVGNVRLFAHTVFVALIYLIAGAPRIPIRFTLTAGLLGLLVLAMSLAWLGELYPTSCLAVTTSPVVRWALVGLWVVGPLVVMGHALRTRCATVYRVGLALEIVAVAHALRVSQGSPGVALDLRFSSVRLLGIVLLLCEAVGVTRMCLTGVQRASDELIDAQMKLQRVRERDHELRNGLAGLAGVTKYIHVAGDESSALHRAVTAELARLNAMMRTTPDTEPCDISRPAAARALRRRTDPRRSGGIARIHRNGHPPRHRSTLTCQRFSCRAGPGNLQFAGQL